MSNRTGDETRWSGTHRSGERCWSRGYVSSSRSTSSAYTSNTSTSTKYSTGGGCSSSISEHQRFTSYTNTATSCWRFTAVPILIWMMSEPVPIVVTRMPTLFTMHLKIPLLEGGVNDANNLLWRLLVLVLPLTIICNDCLLLLTQVMIMTVTTTTTLWTMNLRLLLFLLMFQWLSVDNRCNTAPTGSQMWGGIGCWRNA